MIPDKSFNFHHEYQFENKTINETHTNNTCNDNFYTFMHV